MTHLRIAIISTATALLVGCGIPMWGESDCDAVGPGECEARADCNLIFAAPLTANSCLGDMQPTGCTTAMSECQGETSVEADAGGTCWFFRDSCRPAGWTTAADAGCSLAKLESAPACAEPSVDCTELEGNDCLAESTCEPVYARPHDAVDSCIGPPVPVACAPRGQKRCAGQATSVQHHGDCWLFVDTCVPPEWRTDIDDSLSGCGIADLWSLQSCG